MLKNLSELAFGRIPSYRKYELFMERYRSAAEIVRREMVLKPNTRILDVGCGNGYMKHFFNPGEGRWHGIEVWEERVRCCKRLGYDVTEINIETTAFPFADRHFDVVFASHVIEHLPDPARALSECARVLKPGGLLLVATPTKPPLVAALINAVHRLRKNAVGQTQQAFSAPALRRLVSRVLQDDGARWRLVDCRGLRLISCRKRFNLEDFYWFYRLNTLLARRLTYLAPEVNLIYRKERLPSLAGIVPTLQSLFSTGATVASECAVF